MSILALGISYRRAPLELLERVSVADDDLPKAYKRLADLDAVDEAVLLSTCNRVEVYGRVPTYHGGFQSLKRFLCATGEVEPEALAEPLYSHFEDHAAEHLFSVAGGLDSMVTGEPQILAQVRSALRTARAEGTAGPTMVSLFSAAARAGRRVRAETDVGASPAAFVAAGLELAAAYLGGLTGRSAIVLGAGQMASLAVDRLHAEGVETVRILNRSVEHAHGLAQRSGDSHDGLDALPRWLAATDVVVSLTGAAEPVVSVSMVQEALRWGGDGGGSRGDGGGRGVFLLDLAVPRDVDPGVRDIPGVRLADIDDVKVSLAARDAETETAVEAAGAIVAEEVERFARRRRAERLAPLIAALNERGEEVRARELSRFASRLSTLTDDEREAVEALASGVVAKLLHEPIVRLKELSGPGAGDDYGRALAELFGIEFRLG